jgi:hypothetical protein
LFHLPAFVAPSSQTPLLGSGPLRTVHASFPAHSSSTANASFRETRLGYGKALTVNPVVAFRMKQNAVLGTLQTTFHERDAVVNAPARDPGDLGIANSAEAVLFHPEKAKSFSAPERVQHVKTFPIFEIGFKHRVVGVGFAFDFNVSFNGCATGVVQPSLAWLPLVIIAFPEETPVTPPITPIVFLFEPGRGLFRVPSPCPPPQFMEDRIINVCEGTFADHVPMIVGPTPNLWVEFLNQISCRHAERGFDRVRMPAKKVLTFFLEGLMNSFPLG